MLAERSVDGSREADDDGRFTWSDDISLAEEFLRNHKLVKIVVAIDTHSADNGYFIWTGSDAETYLSRTGIFHVLFTFILSQLTLVVTVQSLTSDTTLHSLSSISSSYFVSDLQENQKRVYSNP